MKIFFRRKKRRPCNRSHPCLLLLVTGKCVEILINIRQLNVCIYTTKHVHRVKKCSFSQIEHNSTFALQQNKLLLIKCFYPNTFLDVCSIQIEWQQQPTAISIPYRNDLEVEQNLTKYAPLYCLPRKTVTSWFKNCSSFFNNDSIVILPLKLKTFLTFQL